MSTRASGGMWIRTRALGAVAVASLGCACGVHGNIHSPGARAVSQTGAGAGGASLRAAFLVPAIAPDLPRAPMGLTASDGTGKDVGLAMKSLTARARVHGPLVETEIRLIFTNPDDRIREGRFRIVLPRHAFVSRLAMKIDGRMREAEIAETTRAREVYDEIVHRRRDPLLVEQHGTNELSARVFPIAPREEKEIVVSWIAEASAELPIAIPLLGLPSIGKLDVTVTDAEGELARMTSEGTVPTHDIRVAPRSSAATLRAGDLFVTRVKMPAGESAAQPVASGLVVLVDTSASRATELEVDVGRVHEILGALAADAPHANVTVAAFDQSVEVAYRGPLAGFDATAAARLRAHGALGASDLGAALRWAGTEARATGAKRVLLIGDGLATAGSAGTVPMRAAAQALRDAGIERLDAVAVGDVRDEGTLRALVVGALPANGVIVDASTPSATIASRIVRSVHAMVPVVIPGARWVWPASLTGVQPGDERLVVAELPANVAPRVRLDGHELTLRAAAAPPPLLEKALARAKVESLVEQGNRDGFTDALRSQVVALARTKRVPSPFTSFLVVESDADSKALHTPRVRPPPAPAPAPAAGSDGDFFAPSPPLQPTPPRAVAPLEARHHVPIAPSLRVASWVVNGRLPSGSVRHVVRQNFGRFRGCYEDGLRRRGPTLTGRVSTKFTIGYDGHVRDSVNKESEIADDKVVSCITEAFRSLEFAVPEGGIVTVVYPLVLRPAGAPVEEETFKETGLPGIKLPSPPPLPFPWTGAYADVRASFDRSDLASAFAVASAARARDSRDVLALLALGEAYEGAHLPDLAARAYGSIADLRPNDAEMLRIAAGRLEHVGDGTLPLVIELLRRASEDRPDHPHGRHAYAMALLRSRSYEQAFEALATAISTSYADRFHNARLVFEDDLAVVAAAWRAAEPARARTIDARTAALTGARRIDAPSLSLVLSWETDSSDVDLFLRDGSGDVSIDSPRLVGSQRAHASDGFGPEAVALSGERGRRQKAHVGVRLRTKGPMGNAMGVVHVVDHDGAGHVAVSARPFVLMNEGAEVDLGDVE